MLRFRLGWLAWLVIVAACIWLPFHDLYGSHGPFARQLSRSIAWKGLSECLLLLGAVYAGLRLQRHGYLLALVALEIYTRRHGLDITLLLLSLYAAGITATGQRIASWLKLGWPRDPGEWLRAGFLGLIAWAAVIWLASAAGLGSIAWIRGLAIGVLGTALCFQAWRWRTLPWVFDAPASRVSAAITATFVTTVAMLAAKSAAAVDSDALWYGLNADRVLLGDGGLLKGQGLVTHVHYYPKLAESLQIPFLGLGSASLVTGLGLVCWALLAATCREVLREFGVATAQAWLGALLACAVPAVAASGATPKGELLAAWCCVFGVLAALRLMRDPTSRGWLGMGVAALVIAPLARLTVIPYAAMACFFLLVVAARRHVRPMGRDTWVPITLALTVFFFTCLRTWLLAGVAFVSPDVLVTLQKIVGWRLHDDIGRYEPVFNTPFPGGLVDSLFGPSRYIHQALFWMGNAWLPLLVAAMALRGWRWLAAPGVAFCFFVGLSMYVLLYAYRYGDAGADGNYFIVPIVLLHLVAWTGAFGKPMDLSGAPWLLAGSGALVAFSLFMVVTTANWEPGTGTMDANFRRTPFSELGRLADKRFATSGMASLARYLERFPPSTRMLGNMPDGDGGYLPLRYEALGDIAWARSTLLADEASLRGLLTGNDIALVALARTMTSPADVLVRHTLDDMAREGTAVPVAAPIGDVDLWLLPDAACRLQPVNYAVGAGDKPTC